MDDDDLRRGRPTAHRAFDEATAILAGTRYRRSPSNSWPTPDRSGRGDPRRRCPPGWRAPRASPEWWEDRCSTSRRKPRPRPSRAKDRGSTGDEDGRAPPVQRRGGRAACGRSSGGARGARGLRPRGRGGVSGRRRPSRRPGRHGDAGQTAGKDAGRRKATFVAALGLDGARRELARLIDEASAAVDAAGRRSGDGLRAAAAFVAARKS